MGYTETFQKAAQRVIAKFCGELGKSTLHMVQEPQDDDYDSTTGVVTPVYVDAFMYVAFDEIAIGSIILGNRHIEMDPNYTRDARIAYIAGLDVTAPPKEDDLITPVGDTKRYRVKDVSSDQYGALYICQISRKPEPDPVP